MRLSNFARVVALLVFLAFSACQPAVDLSKVTQEILERERASFAAWQRGDRAFYEDYWADDMTEFMPDSLSLARKGEMMPRFEEMNRRWQLDSIDILSPEVRLYGDVAV